MRREVNESDVRLLLSEERAMLGETVPSTDDWIVIVRSGLSP